MKRLAISFLVLFAASTVFAQGQKTIELKLGHYAAESHPGQKAALQFAAAVEKRTNGAVKIKVYPNNALGAPEDVLEQNILGAIDMSLPTQGHLAKYSKKFNCVMIPYAFKNYAQVDKVLDSKEFLSWISSDLDKAGLVFLANWEYGFRNLTNSKHPIKVPADAKGLKIRTPAELPIQMAMQGIGANVTAISFSELPMALTQHVVDGQENPVAVIYANKFYESQKYLTLTGHVYNCMVSVISKKTWSKLTPEQQKIVKEESAKASQFMRKTLRAEESQQVEAMKKLGVQVVNPDKAKFKASVDTSSEKLKTMCGGKENIDFFMKLLAKYN